MLQVLFEKRSDIYIVPILTQSLAKQEVCDDEDDWNPSKTTGVSPMPLANCTCNDVRLQVRTLGLYVINNLMYTSLIRSNY